MLKLKQNQLTSISGFFHGEGQALIKAWPFFICIETAYAARVPASRQNYR